MMYRSGGKQGTDDFSTQALLYLNIAHKKIVAGSCELDPESSEIWNWARSRRPKTIVLEPVITTGSVTTTQNNADITFSSAPANSVNDYFIKISTHKDIFRILSHTAAMTIATLDSNYTGSSGSGQSYQMYKLEYTIGSSDILKLISPFRAYRDSATEVYVVDTFQMERQWPLRDIISGNPEFASIVNETNGTVTIRFNKYLAASTYQRVDVDYVPIPSDLTISPDTTPLIPSHFRSVLADYALYLLYSDKNDSRAPEAFELASRGYKMMLSDHRVNKSAISQNFGRPIGRTTNELTRIQFKNGYGWA